MMRAQMVGLLSLTVVTIWAVATAVSAAPYASVADAYLVGNKACAVQFEKMKLHRIGENIAFESFDGVEAFAGYLPVKPDEIPAGVSRFNRNGLFSVGKAELAPGAAGSAYIVVGMGNRGKAQCFAVALDAANAHRATLDWLASPDSGFKPMKLNDTQANYTVDTFGHSLVDDLGTRIDFYYAPEGYVDSIVSFAAFTVGEMARAAPVEPAKSQ